MDCEKKRPSTTESQVGTAPVTSSATAPRRVVPVAVKDTDKSVEKKLRPRRERSRARENDPSDNDNDSVGDAKKSAAMSEDSDGTEGSQDNEDDEDDDEDFVNLDNEESSDEEGSVNSDDSDATDPEHYVQTASLALKEYADARLAESKGWCYNLQKRMAALMLVGGCLETDTEVNADENKDTKNKAGFAFSMHVTANEVCARLSYLTGLRHLESHTVRLMMGLAKSLEHTATLEANERDIARRALHDEIDLALSSVLCVVANITRRLKAATKGRSTGGNAQKDTNDAESDDGDSEVQYAEKRLFQHPSVIKAIVLTLKRVFKSCTTAAAALCEIPLVGDQQHVFYCKT